LKDAEEAKRLRDTFTDYRIPDEIINRLEAAGNSDAQRKEGLAISLELIREIKKMTGLRGIHILSGGNEAILPELLSASGLGK
jgi:methylenetetrahydrofolate reductase (NADPH)